MCCAAPATWFNLHTARNMLKLVKDVDKIYEFIVLDDFRQILQST